MNDNWEEVFKNISISATQKAVSILNEKGILTDEDLGFVAKIGYKEGQYEFVEHLKKHGCDSEYGFTCVYIPSNGEVCAIFDLDKFEIMQARAYLEKNYKGE